MSTKTTPNPKNLASLGAERLADLLMELAAADAAIKRRLRLELAAAHGSDDVAREIKKRLAIIAKAHAFIERPKIKAVVADLELQRRTIAEQVIKINAAQALDLMWEFLGLANSILNRCDDSNGVVGHVFRTALEDLARLAVGRVNEAWTAINGIDEKERGWIPFEWEETRIVILEALGRPEEAQAFRWTCFERSLNTNYLRAYLKRLPDFEDIEVEERALNLVSGTENHLHALHFLTAWPALDKAAQLVERRAGEWDGNRYEYLTPAADALETKHPLAATILRRAMIDYTLKNAKSKRYRHAARHLLECESLAAAIVDFRMIAPHKVYVSALKAQHGCKAGFWEHVV